MRNGGCEVQEDRRGHLREPGKVMWLLHKQEEDYKASERGWHQAHRPTLARVMWFPWFKLEIEGKGYYPGQPVWLSVANNIPTAWQLSSFLNQHGFCPGQLPPMNLGFQSQLVSVNPLR